MNARGIDVTRSGMRCRANGRRRKKNELLENTYREIMEICGSPSLKLMVDKILTKETIYNDSLAKIIIFLVFLLLEK